MQCLILAGGLATRLRPLTQDCPKALVDVLGRPFADYQLRLLKKNGIKDVLYCVGHLGSQIREFVGDGSRWGLKVRYVDEGEYLLGTGGALRKAFDTGWMQPEAFILYGDSYLPIDFLPVAKAFRQSSSKALMTVFKNDGRWDQSNAEVQANKVTCYSKKAEVLAGRKVNYIDYGLSLVEASVLSRIPQGEKYDLSTLFEQLSLAGELDAFEVFTRFFEVGSFEGLENFKNFVKDSELSF